MATRQINTPSRTPGEAPVSTRERDAFIRILEMRWKEFDAAVPAVGRAFSSEYEAMKKTYDSSIELLRGLSSDAELRTNPEVLAKIEESHKALSTHLATAKKTERYNQVLAQMKEDLENFKKQITANTPSSTAETSVSPDVSPAEAPTVPVQTADTTNTPIASSEDIEGLAKDAAKEATDEVVSVLGEAKKDVEEQVEKIKQNPAAAALGFLGFDGESIVNSYKTAFEERRSGDMFTKFIAAIKLVLFRFFAKISGVDMGIIAKIDASKKTDSTTESSAEEQQKTAEEEKKQQEEKEKQEENEKQEQTIKYNATATAIGSVAPKEAGSIITVLKAKEPHMAHMTIADILQYKDTPKELLAKFPKNTNVKEVDITYLMALISGVYPDGKKHALGAFMRNKIETQGKKPNEVTVEELLLAASSDISLITAFQRIDIANPSISLQQIAREMFQVDPTTNEPSGLLVEKAEGLGVTPRLLVHMMIWDGPRTAYRWTTFRSDLVNLNIDWTQEEKETIAKIDAFAGQFTAKIATDEAMHLGMSKALREAIEKNHISQAEIMQAYILTGGKADIGTMSTAEKIGMYISLFSWAIEYAGSMGVGVAEFVNSLVPESIGGKNTMITKMPDDVKEFAEEVMGSERLNSILKGYVKAGFNFMDHFTENATGVTAVAAIALLFTPLFPKRTSIASTLLK